MLGRPGKVRLGHCQGHIAGRSRQVDRTTGAIHETHARLGHGCARAETCNKTPLFIWRLGPGPPSRGWLPRRLCASSPLDRESRGLGLDSDRHHDGPHMANRPGMPMFTNSRGPARVVPGRIAAILWPAGYCSMLGCLVGRGSLSGIAKVGFGTKPASWILVWLRAHGSFPGFVLETPRRGRLKRNARSRGLCILYKVISWPGFVLSPTFWRKQSTMSGFVHLINGKRGVYI